MLRYTDHHAKVVETEASRLSITISTEYELLWGPSPPTVTARTLGSRVASVLETSREDSSGSTSPTWIVRRSRSRSRSRPRQEPESDSSSRSYFLTPPPEEQQADTQPGPAEYQQGN